MSDLDDQTKRVAAAYWGQTPSGARQPVRDAHDIGAPPRAMTGAMQHYLRRETATMFGVWIAFAVLATLSHALVVAATGNWAIPPVFPALFIGLAIWSGRKRADHRRRLARVLTEGELTAAIVRNIRQVEARNYVTTYVTYRVEGTERDVTIASAEQAFAFLQVGLRDEVLFLRTEPGIVVPTFMIA
jgi:hypothetical protein